MAVASPDGALPICYLAHMRGSIFIVVAVIGFALPGLAADSPALKIQQRGHIQLESGRSLGEDLVRGRALNPAGAPLAHQMIDLSSLGVEGHWRLATDGEGLFSLAVSTDPERLGWSATSPPTVWWLETVFRPFITSPSRSGCPRQKRRAGDSKGRSLKDLGPQGRGHGAFREE